jgi:hypothetical protein
MIGISTTFAVFKQGPTTAAIGVTTFVLVDSIFAALRTFGVTTLIVLTRTIVTFITLYVYKVSHLNHFLL